MKHFFLDHIAKTGDLKVDSIKRQYKTDKMAKFMEIKSINHVQSTGNGGPICCPTIRRSPLKRSTSIRVHTFWQPCKMYPVNLKISLSPWRPCPQSALYSCCTIPHCSWPELFLHWNYYWRKWILCLLVVRATSLWASGEGLDKVWWSHR